MVQTLLKHNYSKVFSHLASQGLEIWMLLQSSALSMLLFSALSGSSLIAVGVEENKDVGSQSCEIL